MRSTNAIRDFLQYAEDNWQTPPQYVLVLGDAHYDFRNYENGGNNNYVPTKMVDTVYMETGSDEALADFDDDGLAEIPIGRIPARDAATVTLAYNKTTSFELTVGQWTKQRRAFFQRFAARVRFCGIERKSPPGIAAEYDDRFHNRKDCINPAPPAGQTGRSVSPSA